MLFHFCLSLVVWTFSLMSVSATSAPGHLDGTYHAAGLANTAGGRMLRRATAETVFSHSSSQQWEGVLFAASDNLQIACHTCYVTGTVTGSYTDSASINTTALEKTATDFIDDNYEALKDFYEHKSNSLNVDFSNVSLSGSVDLDWQLQLQFEDLELYMDLDIKLSNESTYTYTLLKLSPVGVPLPKALDSDAKIGASVTVDLIISSKGDLDVRSGVHIKVDSASVNIGMFDNNVGGITMEGGMFEFLPVTVNGGDFELSGSLHVGVNVDVGFDVNLGVIDVSAGLGAGVYANIAEFTTTGTANGSDENCDLALVEGFTMARGAEAGATVAFDSHHWGPTPETETPIWYTELATACGTLSSSSSPTSPSSAVITARQAGDDDDDAYTTTTTTYSIVSCNQNGRVNCPVSDQATITVSTIVTLTTTAGSDASATAQQTSSISRIPFRSDKHDLVPTSGKLVSYSPPPASATATATATGGAGAAGAVIKAVKDHEPLIIGLSVGLGVPALLAIVAGAIFCLVRRRKRYSPARQTDTGGEVVETAPTAIGVVPKH